MSRSRIAPALIVVAALVAIGWIGRGWSEPSPRVTGEQVCGALAGVVEALDGSSLGDEAVLPRRAAELADLLSRGQGGGAGVANPAAAGRIVAVLEDPGATVADLEEVIAPIARECRLKSRDS